MSFGIRSTKRSTKRNGLPSRSRHRLHPAEKPAPFRWTQPCLWSRLVIAVVNLLQHLSPLAETCNGSALMGCEQNMPIEKALNAEPIQGYRLIEPLGRGGFGEVWKCEAPGCLCKAIKFVQGSTNDVDDRCKKAEEELRAVQHIKSIRHPFLLSIDRVEVVAGELVIVTELADQNLHELLQKYRALGKPGVPREE